MIVLFQESDGGSAKHAAAESIVPNCCGARWRCCATRGICVFIVKERRKKRKRKERGKKKKGRKKERKKEIEMKEKKEEEKREKE